MEGGGCVCAPGLCICAYTCVHAFAHARSVKVLSQGCKLLGLQERKVSVRKIKVILSDIIR